MSRRLRRRGYRDNCLWPLSVVHLQVEQARFRAAVRRIAEAGMAHGKVARGWAETEAQIEGFGLLPSNEISKRWKD